MMKIFEHRLIKKKNKRVHFPVLSTGLNKRGHGISAVANITISQRSVNEFVNFLPVSYTYYRCY